jgi:Fe-S-cluster containining protein
MKLEPFEQRYISKSLKGLLNKVFSGRQTEYALSLLKQYQEDYQKRRQRNSLVAADLYHDLLDSYIGKQTEQESELSSQITCQKGCANCCYQKVVMTEDEALLIVEYIIENELEIDWIKVKKQSQWNPDQWHSLPLEERRCAFLDVNNHCRVFPARPGSCRRLLSMDKPEKCLDPQKDKPKMFVVPEAEIVLSATFASSNCGLMAEMLTNLLKNPSPSSTPESEE